MKKIRSKVYLKNRIYSSKMKRYWNDACKNVNEINAVHDAFKFRMRELQRARKTEDKYKSDFIGIVNMTYGEYLGVTAENFSECKGILGYAKKKRIALNDVCTDMKHAYMVSTDSVHKYIYEN